MTIQRNYPDTSSIRKLPALTSQVIPAQWEDQNGHINVSFYMSIYNASGWPMLDMIGIGGPYFSERRMGLVDLDNHLRYLNELHVGERVSAYGRYLSHDEKRIQGMVFVVNDDKDELACTIEFLSINIDLRKRRAAAIPDDIAARLRSVMHEHQKLGWAVPSCLSIPDSKSPG